MSAALTITREVAIALAIGCGVPFAVGLMVTPVLRWLAHRLNVTDRPDAVLKPHARPTAYLGGVGFYVAWLAGLAAIRLFCPACLDSRAWAALTLVAGVGGGVMLIGLLDDIRHVNPWLRLLAEAAAAVLLFIGCGLLVADWQGVDLAEAGLAAVLVGVLVIGACNATNMLDGLDGLCGGVCAIVLLGLAAMASGACIRCTEAGQSAANLRLVMTMALPMAAGLLAFLCFNYRWTSRPASIFMGDAGSLLLGFTIAACIALLAVPGAGPGQPGQQPSQSLWSRMPLAVSGLVIFAVPIADAGLALARRRLNRRPLFEGDRSHFYDQLVDRGLPVRRVVNLCYLAAAVFACIGWVGGIVLWAWLGFSFIWSLLLYAVAAVTVGVLLWKNGFVRGANWG